MTGRMISAVLALALLGSTASAATIYVAKTGNDTTGDGSAANPFLTIGRALTEAASLPGPDTIEVAAGTYAEQVRIFTPVTLNGAPGAILTGGGTITVYNSQRPVVLVGDTATVQGFEIRVNRSLFASDRTDVGVMLFSNGSGPAANPINSVIQNNVIRSFGSGGSNPTGIYYRNNTAGNRPVTIRANEILPDSETSPTSVFTRGMWFYQGLGTIGGPNPSDGNRVIGISQDLLAQFNSAGPMIVRNNRFQGAGLDFTEPNAAGATTVSDNSFEPLSPAALQSLLLKHNIGNAPFTIENNTFTGHGNIAIWVGAWRNTTIRNNTFTPAPGSAAFTHIRIDSAVPGTNVYTGGFKMGAVIQGNVFNPGTVDGGTAIAFRNDRKPNLVPANAPYFTAFTFGGAGSLANTFEGGATNFANYIDIFGGNLTTNYNENFDVQQNLFRVAGGLKRPVDMTYAELDFLHDKFLDTFDAGNTNAGYGRVRPNQIYLKAGMSIARAEALSAPGDTVELGAGTYTAGADVTKNLTVVGVDGWRNTFIQGTGTGTAFEVSTATTLTLADLTIDNFDIGIDMDPGSASTAFTLINFSRLTRGINSRAGSSVNGSLSIFDPTVLVAYEPQGAPASVSLRNNVFGTSNVYFAQAFYGAPFTFAPDAFDNNFYLDRFFRDDDAVVGDGFVNSPTDITAPGSAQTIFDNLALAQFDGDADGLIDAFEGPLGGAVRNFDRDGDGVPDGAEVALGTDPNNAADFPAGFSLTLDTDGDGYVDWYELAFGTSTSNPSIFPQLGNVDPSSPGVQLGDAIRALQIINGSITPFQGGANPHAINVTGAAQPVSLNNPLQILRFQNGSRISLPAVPGIN